ncbi:hypothetical protein CBS76997_1767 [Aspergillus niger]|nr:hypothetical protein CBS13152_4630 [Aspergillus niger]KAI2977073.1 hypothetical protein CBS147323_83 [Aspergillus niger]KAI3051179.1 hypothetical protein CBS76997_1767 [Aspergillus niger]
MFFGGTGQSVFQVVVLLRDMDGLRLAMEQWSSFSIATSLYLRADEATYFVPRTFVQAGGPHPDLDLIQGRLFRSVIVEESVQSPLCVNRPEPRKHNGELLWDSPGGKMLFSGPTNSLQRPVTATTNSIM